MAATRSDWSALLEDWSAGFGEVTVRTRVNGPGSFRFTVTTAVGEQAGERYVFTSGLQVGMALYLCGQPVSRSMSSARAAELIMVGAARGDYVDAARRDVRGDFSPDPARFDACHSVGYRIVALTSHPEGYPDYRHWHPAWRVDNIAAAHTAALAGVDGRARELEAVSA
jgi:hypothetical protein